MSTHVTIPNGIDGLEGREQVGAVVTIGRKDSNRGFPIEKDRFHIVWPVEVNGRRDPHPHFGAFNKAPAEHRRMLTAQLVHARRDEAFAFRRQCFRAPRQPSHPRRLPFCMGDGTTAQRWTGREFREIECPGDRCEFSQQPAKGKAPCGPHMKALFRLVWTKADFPTPLCKFTSNGWGSTANWVGFFDGLERAAATLGFEDYSLAGFRFQLQLVEKTNPETNSRFPVCQVIPLDDPYSFFLAQVEARKQIAAAPKVAALAAPVRVTDAAEVEQIAADHRQNTPPMRGTRDVEDVEAEIVENRPEPPPVGDDGYLG